jgi:hypothetical protein
VRFSLIPLLLVALLSTALAGDAVPAAPAVAADVVPLKWNTVGIDEIDDVNYTLTEQHKAESFHVKYEVRQMRRDEEHEFKFPSLGFYWRVDKGSVLKFRGPQEVNQRISKIWRVGKDAKPNKVEAWYDGREVLLMMNGNEFGPIEVRPRGNNNKLSRWKLSLMGTEVELLNLVVTPWEGPVP